MPFLRSGKNIESKKASKNKMKEELKEEVKEIKEELKLEQETVQENVQENVQETVQETVQENVQETVKETIENDVIVVERVEPVKENTDNFFQEKKTYVMVEKKIDTSVNSKGYNYCTVC